MFVAIRRYSGGDPSLFDDLKDKLQSDFIPKVKTLPGFSAYYCVRTGADTLATVSVFETPEGEKQSNQLALEFVKRNFPDSPVERITLDEGISVAEEHAGVPA